MGRNRNRRKKTAERGQGEFSEKVPRGHGKDGEGVASDNASKPGAKDSSKRTTSDCRSADTSQCQSLQHEHSYPEWNPMEGVADSLLNTVSGGDATAVDRLLTGIGDVEKKYILCPHNHGKGPEGGCFKVSCPYKHVPYSAKTLKELPKLEVASSLYQEPIRTVSSSLPVQIFPANDCISRVVVSAAVDPGNFYVIPEERWKCLCSSHEDTGNKPTVNSFDLLENLQSSLQTRFRSSKVTSQTEFVAGELVAVRMPTKDGAKVWYRAKVSRDAVMISAEEEDLFKPVDVEVQLLDFGLRCCRSSKDITALPQEHCQASPLAYKCQLYGISPIMGWWSNRATERFKQLVLGHYIIAEVVRTATPATHSLLDDPCLINMYVKSQDGEYIDVAQDLINVGFGIEWNLYSKRPYLNKILEGRAHRFALIN